MSHDEALTLDSALNELETRILARVGRYVFTIMGTLIFLAVGASTQWFGLVNRMDKLETWKAERVKPIEDYYADKQADAERFARLEARVEEILRLLKQEQK